MVRTSPPARSPRIAPQQSARRILLPVALLASLLWHLFLFNWASGHIVLPAMHEEKPAVIATALLTPPAAIPEPPPPVAAKPKRKPRPRPAAPAPAAETVAMAPAPAPPQAAPAPPVPEEAVVPAAEEPPQAGEPARPYKFDLPPSAELKYEVQALREASSGSGPAYSAGTRMPTVMSSPAKQALPCCSRSRSWISAAKARSMRPALRRRSTAKSRGARR